MDMARVKFRVRWYLPLALCLLLLPFIIERTVGYYTDGQDLRAPEEEAEDSLRSVLWEDPRLIAVSYTHLTLPTSDLV